MSACHVVPEASLSWLSHVVNEDSFENWPQKSLMMRQSRVFINVDTTCLWETDSVQIMRNFVVTVWSLKLSTLTFDVLWEAYITESGKKKSSCSLVILGSVLVSLHAVVEAELIILFCLYIEYSAFCMLYTLHIIFLKSPLNMCVLISSNLFCSRTLQTLMYFLLPMHVKLPTGECLHVKWLEMNRENYNCKSAASMQSFVSFMQRWGSALKSTSRRSCYSSHTIANLLTLCT